MASESGGARGSRTRPSRSRDGPSGDRDRDKKCFLCGHLDRYMTRFTNWKALEKEFVLQHVVKTPSDDSCICKKCMLEAKRHCRTPDYIPKWKEKLTVTPRLMQKCIHPQCTDTDKLIHASFDETDNLEAALGVTASPDNPLLLC